MSSSDGFSFDDIPAAPPPDGQESNLLNPVSKAHIVAVLDILFLCLVAIAVSVRVYVRTRIVKSWGWDDTTCVLATAGVISHTIVDFYSIKIGYGRHLWDIPASWLLPVKNSQLMGANGITYPFTILFTKVSIVLLYLRIFGASKTLRITSYFGIAIIGAFYWSMIAVAIVSFTKCTGVQALELSFCKTYSGPIVLLNASFNVATDLWVLLLPVPLLFKLQMRLRQRLGLLAVFAAGLAACAASIARLISFSVNYSNPDVFWVEATNAIYTTVELHVAIIVACASCFPSFYAKAKEYLQITTNSIRSRFHSSREESSWSTYRKSSSHEMNSFHRKRSHKVGGMGPYVDMDDSSTNNEVSLHRGENHLHV